MIVNARPKDAYAAAKLAVQMWEHPIDALAAEFEETLRSSEDAMFLYMDQGMPIGFAHCSLRHDYVEGTDSSPVGYLEGVFVEETYRKQGVAKMLVEACESWAKEMGCVEFASDCEIDNTASLAFHLSIGFAEESRNIHFAKKL